MSTTTKAPRKSKLARTDYTICVCTNDRHDAVAHRTPPRPVVPSAALVASYVGGHIIQHHITWTPWKRKA